MVSGLIWRPNVGLGRDVAGAGRGQFVDVDEQALVGVARVEGQHAVVDVLLQTFAVVARGQGTASSFGEQAGFDALGLSISGPSLSLDNDAPFAVYVLGTQRAGVVDIRRADESLTADPVALVELLSVVERVVEFLLLFLGDAIDQIVSGLGHNIGPFLQSQRIVIDGVLRAKFASIRDLNE